MSLQVGSPDQAGMLPERVERARDLCAGWVKSGHTPSLSVCAARRGVIVLHEAFGRLTPGDDAPPLERDSIFALGSGAKPITATVVMQLVEDGLLGLNRPVLDYVPEIATEGAEEMLVHHLLTHTAGYLFHSDPPMVEFVAKKLQAGFEMPPCPENQHPIVHQAIHLFAGAPLAVPPGEKMIYSNINYEILGEIVRRVAGRPHWELAQERILEPVGMNDSYFIVPESEAGRVVQRPPEAPMAQPESPLFQGLDSRQMQETPYAGAGLFSTALDLAKFCQVFLDGGRAGDQRILSPASVAAMTRDQIPGVPALFLGSESALGSWGYGWALESPCKWSYYHGSLQSLGTFNHGGAGGTKFWVDPAREIVGVYIEACMREGENMVHLWNVDLFENAVTAAATD